MLYYVLCIDLVLLLSADCVSAAKSVVKQVKNLQLAAVQNFV